MEKHKKQAILQVFVTALNIVLTIFLIKWNHLIGASIGTAISYLVGDVLIMNIIFNAIAHSAENTTFYLSAKCKHNTVEFYIENYCIKGQFNQESLNQLFERFAIARERFRQVGAGIGLYIVKEIVKVLDGNLYLKVQDSDLEHYDKFQIKFSIPKNISYLKDKFFNFK